MYSHGNCWWEFLLMFVVLPKITHMPNVCCKLILGELVFVCYRLTRQKREKMTESVGLWVAMGNCVDLRKIELQVKLVVFDKGGESVANNWINNACKFVSTVYNKFVYLNAIACWKKHFVRVIKLVYSCITCGSWTCHCPHFVGCVKKRMKPRRNFCMPVSLKDKHSP